MPRDNSSRGSGRDSGFALLIVLWTMVMLAMLAGQVTGAGRADTRMAAALRQSAALEEAANGAIYETIWHMLEGSGQAWPQGSGVYDLKEPGAPVHVEVEDQRGKIDVNQVPAGLMAALFMVLGADPATANEVANNIGDWRSESSPGDSDEETVPPEYRMDGRAWAPPGQNIERMDELLLVRGMTPPLYQAALPYLTRALEQGPWMQYAGPTVLAAIQKAKVTAGLTVDDADDRGPTVLLMQATATGPNNARFVRTVLMRFDGTLSGPAWKYRILEWY